MAKHRDREIKKRGKDREDAGEKLPSRRNFLGIAAVAGGGLILAGLAGGLYLMSDGPAPPTPPKPKGNDDPDRDIGQAEINKEYVILRSDLAKLVDSCKAEKKKLVILLGEEHGGAGKRTDPDRTDKKTVLLEMMVLQALKEIDPQGTGATLMSEVSQKEYNEVISQYSNLPGETKRENTKAPFAGKILSSIYALHRLKMSVHPADDDAVVDRIRGLFRAGKKEEAEHMIGQTMPRRDQRMAEVIHDKAQKGGVAILGLGHLLGVSENLKKLEPDTAVMAINLTSLRKSDVSEDAHRAMHFATSPEYVNQRDLPGRVTMGVDEMAKMIAHAVEAAPETMKMLNKGSRGVGE